MRPLVLSLTLLLIAACAPRGEFVRLPEGADPADRRTVFVASVRPGDARYSRVDVSVPRDRAPGQIRYPEEAPDPDRHFLVESRRAHGSVAAFRAEIAEALQSVPPASREIVVYVHGFNTAPAEGVFRMAQLSEDLDLPGVAVHYSWPSAAKPLAYAHDRDMALWSRDGLRALIRELDRTGARGTILLAHSMSAQLVMETLRDMALEDPAQVTRLVDAVVLISPDVDVGLFRRQAATVGALPQPFAIVTSSRDRALRLSARLTGQRNRLGNLSDATVLSDLEVVILDVSAFSQGVGHFTAGNSPLLLSLFRGSRDLGAMLGDDASGRTGLLPGTVLSIRNATHVILAPTGN